MTRAAQLQDPTLAADLAALPEPALRWVVAPGWGVDPGLDVPAIRARILEAAEGLAGKDGAEVLAGLDKPALRLLWAVLAAERPLPLGDLAQAFARGDSWTWARIVAPLRTRLLVAPAPAEGWLGLAAPQELRAPLRALLGIPAALEPEPLGPASPVLRDPIAELAWAMAFVAAGGRVRVTQSGSLHRVDVRRFAEMLRGEGEEDEDEDAEAEEARMGEAEALLGRARALGFFRGSAGEALEPCWESWERFLALPRDESVAALLALFTPLSRPPEAALARAALEALSSLEPGTWYAEATLRRLAARRLLNGAIVIPEVLASALSGPLAHLGLAAVEGRAAAPPAIPRAAGKPCPSCGKAHGGTPEEDEPDDDLWDDDGEAVARAIPDDAPLVVGTPAAGEGRFCVSPRLRGVVKAWQGPVPPAPAPEQEVRCLVVNPDYEAVLLHPEPDPGVFAALPRIALPKPGAPVWRVQRGAAGAGAGGGEALARLGMHLRAPLPGNVERALRDRLGSSSGTATRLAAALLVEGPGVDALLRDPQCAPLLEPVGPGVARLRAGSLDALPRLAAKLGCAGPWSNARLLAQLAGHDKPPTVQDVERTYGWGARRMAEGLGIQGRVEERGREAATLLREARAKFSAAAPPVDRGNGRAWAGSLAVPKPPRLDADEEEVLLACHRAMQRGEPVSASVELSGWNRTERLRGPFEVHAIATSPDGVTVELSQRGPRGRGRFRAELEAIELAAPGAQQPRHSWRRARGAGR